jgi:hypothetical protein
MQKENRNDTCARRDQTSPGDYAGSCDSVLMVSDSPNVILAEDEINKTTSNKECEATSEEEHMIEMQSNDAQELEDEDSVDVADLHDPHITEDAIGQALTSDEWAAVRALVDDYRSKIPKTRCLYK